MLKDINYRRVAFGVALGGLLLMVIFLAYAVLELKEETYSLQKTTLSLQADLSKKSKQVDELKIQLAKHEDRTQDRFESAWRSFARVRNNFISLGHGFHLEKEDIAPEEVINMMAKNVDEREDER